MKTKVLIEIVWGDHRFIIFWTGNEKERLIFKVMKVMEMVINLSRYSVPCDP